MDDQTREIITRTKFSVIDSLPAGVDFRSQPREMPLPKPLNR